MGFLEKTLKGIANYITDALYSERYASQRGLLQILDPRVKLMCILALIFLAVWTGSLRVFLFLLGFSLFLAAASGISISYYLMRVWLFVPLFTFFIAIPAIFEAVTPGETIFSWAMYGININITKEGVMAATTLVLRVATTISLAVLLTLTTRWESLMRSLRYVGVPTVFIMIMTLTYRYIFYLFSIMQAMILSRKGRSGVKQSAIRNWKMYAPLIGALFIRSYETNERVYMAMKARGFGGEMKYERPPSPGMVSVFFIIMVFMVCLVVISNETGVFR